MILQGFAERFSIKIIHICFETAKGLILSDLGHFEELLSLVADLSVHCSLVSPLH